MKIISSKEVYKCRIFTIAEEVAKDESGFEIERSVIRHPGSSVMLAVDENRRILLVRQYRLPAQQRMWEIPAGKIDPGEKPLETAKRELIEETGYSATHWTPLVSFWPSPGYCEEKMNLFLATGLTAGEPHPMDDEQIEIAWFPADDLEKMIQSGEMQDGKTIVGFYSWRYNPAYQS